MHIRHLPGKKGFLVDPNDVQNNMVMYNPSATDNFVYLRITKHTAVDETNSIMLLNETTKKIHSIDSPMHLLKKNCNLFKGIEDLRIVMYHGMVWFTATTTHASEEMNNEMVVGHFDKNLSCVERMSVINVGPLPVKNVCPFVHNEKLCLLDAYRRCIYEVTEEVDENNNFLKFVATKIKNISCAQGIPDKGFRGSTSPVHLHGNTWGFLVHDIIFNDNEQLVTRLAYYHHWVEMDVERGVITYFSSPFWCMHWGIEYISGLRYLRNEDIVELFIGIQDRSAAKCQTSLSNLRIGK
jgi:hypothetical protein